MADRRLNHPQDPSPATRWLGRASQPAQPRAWSEELSDEQAPTQYSPLPEAPTQYGQVAVDATEPPPAAVPPLPWFRRPGILFVIAATAAAIAVVGLVITTRSGGHGTPPPPSTVTGPPARPTTSAAISPATSPRETPGPPSQNVSCPEGTVASGDRCITNPRMCPDGTVVAPGEPCAPAAIRR
jgi:hypothetical protein